MLVIRYCLTHPTIAQQHSVASTQNAARPKSHLLRLVNIINLQQFTRLNNFLLFGVFCPQSGTSADTHIRTHTHTHTHTHTQRVHIFNIINRLGRTDRQLKTGQMHSNTLHLYQNNRRKIRCNEWGSLLIRRWSILWVFKDMTMKHSSSRIWRWSILWVSNQTMNNSFTDLNLDAVFRKTTSKLKLDSEYRNGGRYTIRASHSWDQPWHNGRWQLLLTDLASTTHIPPTRPAPLHSHHMCTCARTHVPSLDV